MTFPKLVDIVRDEKATKVKLAPGNWITFTRVVAAPRERHNSA